MIDGTFQAPRCSPSRHQRFGVLSTVGGKGGLGMTVLERGRPERLHRLDAEGDHLVDEPFGIVEDGLRMRGIQRVHGPQVFTDNRPCVGMGTVDENVGHAQAVIFGKSAAYGEGDFSGDTYQIEGDQQGTMPSGIFQGHGLGPQFGACGHCRMIPGCVTAHPNGLLRGDDGSAEACLPTLRRNLGPTEKDQAPFQGNFGPLAGPRLGLHWLMEHDETLGPCSLVEKPNAINGFLQEALSENYRFLLSLGVASPVRVTGLARQRHRTFEIRTHLVGGVGIGSKGQGDSHLLGHHQQVRAGIHFLTILAQSSGIDFDRHIMVSGGFQKMPIPGLRVFAGQVVEFFAQVGMAYDVVEP